MPRRPDHPSRDRPRPPDRAGKYRPHRPHAAAAGKSHSDPSRPSAAHAGREQAGEGRGRPDREHGRKEWRRGKEHRGGPRPEGDARARAEGPRGEARPGRDRKPFHGKDRGRPWKDRKEGDRPERGRDDRPRKEGRFGRSGPARDDPRDKPRWEKREARADRESRRQSGWSRGRPADTGQRPAPAGNPRERLELAARPEEKLVRIAGLPSVAELFENAPNRVERLYFEADRKGDVEGWCEALGRRHKVYRQVGAEEMKRVAGTAMHGGVVALAHPRAIHELEIGEAEAWGAAGKPLLILDGVGNPQNIGAIARTAAFLGVERMVLSDHPEQAGLSDTSYRVAKGALEHIELYRARGIVDVLARLKSRYDVIGTAIGRGKPLTSLEKTGKPVALVLGNEEAGLSPATLAACTAVVSIPGSGRVQSLNVSATAAILIFELLRRR